MNGDVRTPAHLWIVGIAATLWNAMGCFDYVMTQTANAWYLSMFTEAQRAYFESFPAWMEGAWAVGVWGGLLGSLLLLMRSRHSIILFALSLLGLAASTVYQYVMTSPPPDMMSTSMLVMTAVIWVVAIFLFFYARRMHSAGVLR